MLPGMNSPAAALPAPVPPLARRELAWAVLGCGLVAALFLGPALFTGRVLSPADLLYDYYPWHTQPPPGWAGPSNTLLGDSVAQFEPWLSYTAARLRAGGLPLWNPDNLLGAPFLGNMQSAVFSPLNWPYYLWPDPAVLALRAWLKLFLAALGMYLLARQVLRVRPAAAALAALTFALGAFMTVWLLHPQTATALWLPWLWWATAGLVARPGPRWVAALAAIVGASLLGGHPETAYHAAEATGLFVLFAIWQSGRRRPGAVLGVLGLWAGAYVLGAVLAAVQILPFLEYSAQSVSLLRRTERQLLNFWLPFSYAWTAVSPDLFGNPARHTGWGAIINYNEANSYSGVLPLLLAPLAILTRDRGHRRLAVFLLAVAGLALGVVYKAPVVFEAALALPGMRLMLNHRLLVVVEFALALLAALGAETLRQRLHEGRRLLAGAVLVISAGWLAGGVGVPWLLAHTYFAVPADPAANAVWQAGLARGALLVLLCGGVLGAVIALAQARPRAARLLLGLLPVVVLADLWQAHGDYLPTIARAAYLPPTVATTFLQRQPGLFRIVGGGWQFMVDTNLVYGLADVRGYDAVDPLPYYQLVFAPWIKGNTHTRLNPSPLLDLLNVRYLLVAPGDDPNTGPGAPPAGAAPYVRVLDGGTTGASIYENPGALPRAWLVHRAEVQPDAEARPARLADPAFDRAGTALLNSPLLPDQPLPPAAPPAGMDVLTITRYLPEQVEIATASPAPGLLILADEAFPGWEAQVDGGPVPILTVDHALRGVYLPAGSHAVRFSYRPASFAWGAALSGVALLVLGGLAIWPGRRGQRSAVPPPDPGSVLS